ncbi:MAG: DEAD/DEAH box helicase [Spirochaetia bacterium]|jgi:ATP-dependent RNA helicase RhlB|nr:DEAD/DEAH box helicase [Spirochaetia bacterium]
MKFREWNLDENLLKGIEEAGYSQCMPVQEETLDKTLKNIDVLVQSQTGSGKTAAFIVSVFQLFLAENAKRSKAIAIVPTRELAVQIEEEAELLGKYLNFKIASFYGGVGYEKQEKLLQEGVDIIVGTPGRLIDLNQSKKLDFHAIDILIIDEADRLFDMGFLPDIRKMLKKMKPKDERHTMLFSATLNSGVRQVAWEYMNNPADITINPETLTVDGITQELYHVGRTEKINLLIGLLRKANPRNALIFTNTKQAAFEVSHRLEINGFKSKYIIGDLPQAKRLKTIDDMKSGKIPVLVATDVAARGLHIDDLELVVNYDIPEDCENYVHRIGRTARAGKTGRAISLACERYVYGLEAIENFIDMKIPISWADDSLFAADSSKGKYFNLEKSKLRDPADWSGESHAAKRAVKKEQPARTAEPEKRKQPKRETADNKPYDKQYDKKYDKPYDKQDDKPYDKPQKEERKERKDFKKVKTAKQKPMRKSSLEKRLQYYSEKYGENFSLPEQNGSGQGEKKSVIGRIKSLFKKKPEV